MYADISRGSLYMYVCICLHVCTRLCDKEGREEEKRGLVNAEKNRVEMCMYVYMCVYVFVIRM
jgi:hypothetical protein